MNEFKNSLVQVLWQAFDVICGNLICLILRITTITAILFLLSLARGDSSLSDCYITQILSGAPAPPIIHVYTHTVQFSHPNRVLLSKIWNQGIVGVKSLSNRAVEILSARTKNSFLQGCCDCLLILNRHLMYVS